MIDNFCKLTEDPSSDNPALWNYFTDPDEGQDSLFTNYFSKIEEESSWLSDC